MNNNELRFQKEFLANLKLNLLTSEYTKCPPTWREIDYIYDYNKFYFIFDGEGYIKIGDNEFYPKAGQLFLMPAGVLESHSNISDNTFEKYWCHFTAYIGDVNIFDIIQVPAYIDCGVDSEFKMLFQRLINVHRSENLSDRLIEKAILLEIIAAFIDKAGINSFRFPYSSSMDRLSSVLKYIEDHISEEINVSQLANLLHFHPNYFTRIFKKYVGISPVQYINKVRLEKAKYFLKTSGSHINEIARKTGFCDIYHFSKTFKSYTGFSPSEYRNI
jgi:AraC family transcriptional regulator of arabinose operon